MLIRILVVDADQVTGFGVAADPDGQRTPVPIAVAVGILDIRSGIQKFWRRSFYDIQGGIARIGVVIEGDHRCVGNGRQRRSQNQQEEQGSDHHGSIHPSSPFIFPVTHFLLLRLGVPDSIRFQGT